MKTIKYIGYTMLSAGFLLATASCTDYDDYNTEPEVGTEVGANKTLWENISSDRQLTRFAALARKSKYDEVLNTPRFYTLWAPVDDAIGDAEYNTLMASKDSVIVKEFMQQHMTQFAYGISAELDSMTIVSLNDKHHPFTQKEFDGFSYVPGGINLPSTNGMLHKINGYSAYHLNIYENIDKLQGCDKLRNYIQRYDEEYLDLSASVLGPLRDGKQTYLDSVMKKRNNVISRLMNAKLDNEDSTYCMLIPNDKAWQSAYDSILPRYNYIRTMDYLDLDKKKTSTAEAVFSTPTIAKADKAVETESSLQDSIACRNIAENLVFSDCFAVNAPFFSENGSFADNDTVISTSFGRYTNAQELLNHTVEYSPMSNGVCRVIDSLTFDPYQTYNPIYGYMTPRSTVKVKKVTAHNIPLDTLMANGRDTLFSEVPPMLRQWITPTTSRYFSYAAVDSINVDGQTSKPEFCFALKNVRSTTYHIYVVTVPGQVEKTDALVKPLTVRFYLSWTDADNKQQCSVLPVGSPRDFKMSTANGTNTNKITYTGNPGKVNVFDLGEFTFPVCYYGLDAYPSLMMMHTESFTSASKRRQNDQQLRVAGVYLVPKGYNDLWANPVNE